MKRKLFKFLFFIFYLLGFLIFTNSINEIITKNPFKEVNKITANKNRNFANLSITANKLNPIKIEPIDTSKGYTVFNIPKENIKNYTFYVSNKEDQIPHELMVNNTSVETDIKYLPENQTIGFKYELDKSNPTTDIIKIPSEQFGNNKIIYIALYDKDKKDVFKLYSYERRLRKRREFIETLTLDEIYLGGIKPGYTISNQIQVAKDLWWFYQAKGGKKWGNVDVSNIDGYPTNETPQSRKFLNRVFLGTSYDFIGRATLTNINDKEKGGIPTFNYQDPVSIKTETGTTNIKIERIQPHLFDNGYYPGWKASGVLDTPVIRSYWRHGLYEITDILYNVYLQVEHQNEDDTFIAGMYELDNSSADKFFVQIGSSLPNPLPDKNPLYKKIKFLLQRGIFESEVTATKDSLQSNSQGKIILFKSFQGKLKKAANDVNDNQRKNLYYAEYGGNYTVETRGDSQRKGLIVNRVSDPTQNGIIIPESLGTGKYVVELRYKNSYNDYLQYDLNGKYIDNYDKFTINYFNNRPEATATINIKGFAKDSYGIFEKDERNIITAKEGSVFDGNKMQLSLNNNGQIPNTVLKNSINENESQKIAKLKVTRTSDNRTFENTSTTIGRKIMTVADDLAFGFENNGDLRIEKKEVSTGQDTYTIEPFDKDNLSLGKITITVTKDEIESVGDIKYDLDKLIFTSSLNGWLKLDGSYNTLVGSASNSIISKMINPTSGNNNDDVIRAINIKEIISVGEYSESDTLVTNNKKISSNLNLETYAKDNSSDDELLAIKKGQAELRNFFELKISSTLNSSNKIYKVIYKDNNNKFKSFKIILNIKDNTYHTLKYDVNMSNFPIDNTFSFNLTPDSFESNNRTPAEENNSMTIRKSDGNIEGVNGNKLGLGTAFFKLSLNEITLKINSSKSSSYKIDTITDEFSLSISKSIESDNINGLKLKATKIKDTFEEKTLKLVYLYNDIIPLGEIEFKLNSGGKDFAYGEGYLNLDTTLKVLKDNSQHISSDTFWYFKLNSHTNENSKSIELNNNEILISNGRYEYISNFKNLPWAIINSDTQAEKAKIEIINGQFYKFTDGKKVSGLNKITIEKDNKKIDEFNVGDTFESDNMKRAKNHRSDELKFGIDNEGKLYIGSLYHENYSGVYKLNFYDKNNIKKGEFILTVFSRSEDKPNPRTKSEDTLIIEIDRRIKQLFKNNDFILLSDLDSIPKIITTKNPNNTALFNQNMNEFITTKMQKGNTSNFFKFFKNSTVTYFKSTKELTIRGNIYSNNLGQILNVGRQYFYLYKNEFTNTDEVIRILHYQGGSDDKTIKIVIRFTGDDKQTIFKDEDISNVILGNKITSSHSTAVKDLLLFNKDSFNGTNVTFSISGKNTLRDYIELKSTTNSDSSTINYDIYRYAKVFLAEKRIYTVKYKGIELQDIVFNIKNLGTEGEATLDMGNLQVGKYDNFVVRDNFSNTTLRGTNNNMSLTNISGTLPDARIFVMQSNGRYNIEGNARKLSIFDQFNTFNANSPNSDTTNKVEIRPGMRNWYNSLKIGVEGNTGGNITGFLFVDKRSQDFIPKLLDITISDESGNIISKFRLKTIVDNPESLGTFRVKISKKLYEYMKQTGKFWITHNGDIADSLENLNNPSKENYKNFMKIEENLRSNLNNNNTIFWKLEGINERTQMSDNNRQFSKLNAQDIGLELPYLNVPYSNLKNGLVVPKVFFEPDINGTRTETFIIASRGTPYSFNYEITIDTDEPEEINGSINTFPIPENSETEFTNNSKIQNNAIFNINDFMNIRYATRETYNESDYSFVKFDPNNPLQINKILNNSSSDFSIYKMKMTYNGDKNGISLNKLKNTYISSFQEAFDVYYKNMRLGTYYLTFENIPNINNGSANLNLSEFGPNSTATFKINSDGTLTKTEGSNYEFTNKQGSFPYANMDHSNLEIQVRKKGEKTFNTLNNTNGFIYTDNLNDEAVLRFDFSSENNSPTFKITKLSEKNDPKTNSSTYEIVYRYKNGNNVKDLGKYDLTIIRNEKDLGLLTLKAKPLIIVNPLVDNGSGTYKVVNSGSFNNKWKKVSFDKETDASNISVKQWLKVNNISKSNNGNFEFSEKTIGTENVKESISLSTGKSLLELIKEARYEYMLPNKTENTTFTFTDNNDKFYKLNVAYQYELFEKQTAAAKLIMTELNKNEVYEFDLDKNTYTDETVSEKNNKKDQKQQAIKLTEASGKIDLNLITNKSVQYKLTVSKNGEILSNNTSGYVYDGANYKIELSDSTLKVIKKTNSAFNDSLSVKIEAYEDDESIALIELSLHLKSESKFAIKGQDVLDFGVISYSPFDITNLARGEKAFTVTGSNGKTLEFTPASETATMKLNSNENKTIAVQNIKIIKAEKDTSNTDQYFFTMEAYAVTKPDMTPGTYNGEVDVTITIKPDLTP